MSYDKIVGKAENPEELLKEMKRLENDDPFCVEYHVREGHIFAWLKETGRGDLSMKIVDAKEPGTVIEILEREVTKQSHAGQHRRSSSVTHSSGKKSGKRSENH